MNTTFAKSLIAAAALALVGSAAYAVPAGTPVTIQEASIPGAAAHAFQADQLSGQYDEVVTFTSATTFQTDVIFNAGQWYLSGTPLQTQLNAFGSAGYGVYAKFTSTGTYSTTAGVTSFSFGPTTLSLWADPNHDTIYAVGATATGSAVLTSGAATTLDDILLGTTSDVLTGAGTSNPGGTGTANGNFELLFNSFTLANPGGLNYFIAPRPFNLQLDLNGNFQSFVPSTGTSIQLLNNSANAFFLPNAVPEPGALALAGIALVGAAVATRRKNGKA